MMDESMVMVTPGARVPNRGLVDVWDTTKPKIEYAELSDTYGKFVGAPVLNSGGGGDLGEDRERAA